MILHVSPAFVVRRIVPVNPQAIPTESSTKCTALRLFVVPDSFKAQLSPPSVVLRIGALAGNIASPTTNPVSEFRKKGARKVFVTPGFNTVHWANAIVE